MVRQPEVSPRPIQFGNARTNSAGLPIPFSSKRHEMNKRNLAANFWLAACLSAAVVWYSANSGAGVPDANASAGTNRYGAGDVAYQPIETIRVGQRVISENPDGAEACIVPSTAWKLLTMRAVETWADGTRDEYRIQTLQSPEWIETHDVGIGRLAPIPLDLKEMGGPSDLQAKVLGIEPCPPLEDGPGELVTTTVSHRNAYVFELELRGLHGLETILVTGHHKIRSATRSDWVSVDQLEVGERLATRGGIAEVIDLSRFPGQHIVYNMTVVRNHTYHVGTGGLLVHNMCDETPKPVPAPTGNTPIKDLKPIEGSAHSAP